MNIRCPQCSSEAVNKYGSVGGGKQRYICLVCERQFVVNPDKMQFKNRPDCPKCGKPMHAYMKGPDYIRFGPYWQTDYTTRDPIDGQIGHKEWRGKYVVELPVR